MSVRRIPTGRRSVTGRLAEGIEVESTLERDFAILHLFDRDVVSISEQPVRIDFKHQGRSRRYTPDFLVTYRAPDRPAELVEVKYQADLAEHAARYAPAFAAAERFARRQGWSFRIATEATIRTTRLENARFLMPYRRSEPDAGVCQRLLAGLKDGPHTAATLIDRVASCLNERATALYGLWHLVARFEIEAGLAPPLTMSSILSLPSGARP